MGRRLEIVTALHTSTTRDYLARMNDNKIEAMINARKFEFDYWDGERRYGYGGYKYIPGRWKSVALELINQYGLDNQSKILDIGCGKAFLLYELQQILPKAHLVGIDISSHALDSAHPDFKGQLLKIDAKETLPFTDNEFDLAISLAVIHNFKLPAAKIAVSEMERVAVNGYIMVESYRNEAELFNLVCWALTAETYFDESEWNWLMDSCGYSGDYELIYFE